MSDGVLNSRALTPGDPGFPNGFVVGGASFDTNRVPSYQVFTLSGTCTFENLFRTETLELFGVVNNPFDKCRRTILVRAATLRPALLTFQEESSTWR